MTNVMSVTDFQLELEHSGNILEHSGIFWNILEHSGKTCD